MDDMALIDLCTKVMRKTRDPEVIDLTAAVLRRMARGELPRVLKRPSRAVYMRTWRARAKIKKKQEEENPFL